MDTLYPFNTYKKTFEKMGFETFVCTLQSLNCSLRDSWIVGALNNYCNRIYTSRHGNCSTDYCLQIDDLCNWLFIVESKFWRRISSRKQWTGNSIYRNYVIFVSMDGSTLELPPVLKYSLMIWIFLCLSSYPIHPKFQKEKIYTTSLFYYVKRQCAKY